MKIYIMQEKIEDFNLLAKDLTGLAIEILNFGFYNDNRKIEANKLWIYKLINSRSLDANKIILKSISNHFNFHSEYEAKSELILFKKINELNFSKRSVNWLENAGIDRVNKLLNLDENKLNRIRGLGKKSLLEINDFKKALKTQIGYEKYIKDKKSDNSNYWKEIVREEIYDLNIKGFGTSKKKILVNEIINSISLTLKIYNSNYKKLFIKIIKNKWASIDDVINLIEFDAIKNFNLLELGSFIYKGKTRNIYLSLIKGFDNMEVSKIHALSRERVRQYVKKFLNDINLINAINHYKLFEEFLLVKETDEKEVYIKKKKENKMGPRTKKFLDLIYEKIDLTGEHIYFDVYKGKQIKLKYSYEDKIRNFYIKKNIYNAIENELKLFYEKIFKKKSILKINKLDTKLVGFLEKFKETIFDTSYVHFTKKYIYLRTMISVEDLIIRSFESQNKKTLKIHEIFNWIKYNFPDKKIKSIEGVRGAMINSKKIIAFGKTGNYGLAKDFGVKNNKELSTKNLIIEILNKYSYPITEDVIENYAMKKNPFLKERSVPMIIEINPKTFTKFSYRGGKELGRSYIGLKTKFYSEPPVNFNVNDLNSYLKSKNCEQEWISLEYFIKKYQIPEYQINDFLKRKGYIQFKGMATLSTGNDKKNSIIIKLIQDKSLVSKVKSYLKLSLKEKTRFKVTLKKIIEKNFAIDLNNNEISKIINFII